MPSCLWCYRNGKGCTDDGVSRPTRTALPEGGDGWTDRKKLASVSVQGLDGLTLFATHQEAANAELSSAEASPKKRARRLPPPSASGSRATSRSGRAAGKAQATGKGKGKAAQPASIARASRSRQPLVTSANPQGEGTSAEGRTGRLVAAPSAPTVIAPLSDDALSVLMDPSRTAEFLAYTVWTSANPDYRITGLREWERLRAQWRDWQAASQDPAAATFDAFVAILAALDM